MQLAIDAWLERREPQIRLFDQDTGREVFRVCAEHVRNLMESGDLSLADFADGGMHSNELLDVLYQRLAERRDPCQRRLPPYMGQRKSRQTTTDYPAWL